MAEEPPSQPPSPLGHSVIPIVNKLQDILAQLGSQSTVDLPQVAVIGSQSSGKSSVLEALVGRDFLPRGLGTCTRRPLVLQLLQTKRKVGGTDEEYGEFLHLPGKRFYDFSEIRREIEVETDREAGGNKGVSDKQIRLKIFSPNVLDITLVDLPGLIKFPIGDQPSDIEARIRTMIMSYVKVPSCLILAVSAANTDLAISDALQLAGMADPDGHRTIGVITKLDIMDRGTNARDLLLGKVTPLRLGFVGVVSRSQEDIVLNRSIKDALVAEEKFFRDHHVYNDLADRCGIPQLAKKLNQILVQHIKALLPGLKSRISSQLVSVANEHASYGEISESKDGQGVMLMDMLLEYSEAFSSMVEGKNKGTSASKIAGGARIHYIFQSIFVKSLEEVDPCEGLTDDDIRTAIQNASGLKADLFVPEAPFEDLVQRQIAQLLLHPSLQCARFIHDELIKMSRRCMLNELQRFPVLRKRMDEVLGNFLREGFERSEIIIRHIIEMEMDYINSSHPNFIGGSEAEEIALQQIKASRPPLPMCKQKDGVELDKAPSSERRMKSRAVLARPVNGNLPDQPVRPVVYNDRGVTAGNTTGSSRGISSIFDGIDSCSSAKVISISKPHSEPVQTLVQASSMLHLREPPTAVQPSENHPEHEAIEIAVTKLLLRSYYDIARKNIEDFVPKAIMLVLVNHTKCELHNVLIENLYSENLFEEMLQETDEVAMKRKRTGETLCVLRQAFQTLDELPLEAEMVEKGYNLGSDSRGLPRVNGLTSSSSLYSTSCSDSCAASLKTPEGKNSSHSGELLFPLYPVVDSNGSTGLPANALSLFQS